MGDFYYPGSPHSDYIDDEAMYDVEDAVPSIDQLVASGVSTTVGAYQPAFGAVDPYSMSGDAGKSTLAHKLQTIAFYDESVGLFKNKGSSGNTNSGADQPPAVTYGDDYGAYWPETLPKSVKKHVHAIKGSTKPKSTKKKTQGGAGNTWYEQMSSQAVPQPPLDTPCVPGAYPAGNIDYSWAFETTQPPETKGISGHVSNGATSSTEKQADHAGASYSFTEAMLARQRATFEGEYAHYKGVDQDDLPTIAVLEAVIPLLPSTSTHADKVSLYHTRCTYHEQLVAVIRCSSILDRAAELLRNTSIDNISSRCKLYERLFDFLRAIVDGPPGIHELLLAPRKMSKVGSTLLEVAFSQPTRTPNESKGVAQPLSYCMLTLVKQCETMQKYDAQLDAVLEATPTQKLWQQIMDCARSVADLVPSGIKVASTDNQHAWQKELAICEVPDEQILSTHFYAKDATAFTNPPKGRMRELVKQLTILHANIPENIFVRHGESRLDVMKILFIGPEGTPYEHGLFEFDLLCPIDFPQSSPLMHLRTTGGGRVRFNPNLYHDGKVCLSLLGTWAGPGWEPGVSTIYQIVTSMQALVFCAEPFCNEPSNYNDQNTSESQRYNHHLYPDVVKYGMLKWIQGKRTPPSVRMPERYIPHNASKEEFDQYVKAEDEMHANAKHLLLLNAQAAKSNFAQMKSQQTEIAGQLFASQNSFAPAGPPPGYYHYGNPPHSPLPAVFPTGSKHYEPKVPHTPGLDKPSPSPASFPYASRRRVPIEPLATEDLGLFADVVRKHFEVNKLQIMETVKRWIIAQQVDTVNGKKKQKEGKMAEALAMADRLPVGGSLAGFLTAAMPILKDGVVDFRRRIYDMEE